MGRVWYFKREARFMEKIKRLGWRGISCNCEMDIPFSVGAQPPRVVPNSGRVRVC